MHLNPVSHPLPAPHSQPHISLLVQAESVDPGLGDVNPEVFTPSEAVEASVGCPDISSCLWLQSFGSIMVLL